MKELFSKVKSIGAAAMTRAKAAVANAAVTVCRTKSVLAESRAEGFVD